MDASARLTTLTRLGFAARGLLYIVIAFLVIRTGRTEDPTGALDYVGQGGGKWLLILMAAGFTAYGIWRVSDAAFNIERHESGRKGVAARLGAAASGLIHLFLAWQAVRLLRGTSGSSGGGAQEGARTALGLPGGELMLEIAGLVLIGVGAFQFIHAAKDGFCENLERGIAHQHWVKWVGRTGFAARGFVFLISGYFLAKAGFEHQPGEAGGMAEALAWLSNPWDLVVALGLLMFGLFSLVEARFRVMHDVPVEGIMHKAKAQLSS